MRHLLITIAAVLMVGCGESQESKDAKTLSCLSTLRMIDNAKEMLSTVEKKADSETPTEDQLGEYFKSTPSCPSGGDYIIGTFGNQAACSIHGTAKDN